MPPAVILALTPSRRSRHDGPINAAQLRRDRTQAENGAEVSQRHHSTTPRASDYFHESRIGLDHRLHRTAHGFGEHSGLRRSGCALTARRQFARARPAFSLGRRSHLVFEPISSLAAKDRKLLANRAFRNSRALGRVSSHMRMKRRAAQRLPRAGPISVSSKASRRASSFSSEAAGQEPASFPSALTQMNSAPRISG